MAALLLFSGFSAGYAKTAAAKVTPKPAVVQEQSITPATLATLHDADSLIALHKYKSAYVLLDSVDAINANPDIAVKKAFIALRYYVNTNKHTVFGFKDLRLNQTIEDIFGRPDIVPIYTFPIETVMLAFYKKDSTRCDISRILGEYYNDSRFDIVPTTKKPDSTSTQIDYQNYLNDSLAVMKVRDSVQKISLYYCNKAAKGGCADWKTYSILGDALLRDTNAAMRDTNVAISMAYMQKSYVLNDSMPYTMYTLSYLYSKKNAYDSAAKYAARAIGFFKTPLQKVNVCCMAVDDYNKLGNKDMAIKYCDSITVIDSINADSRAAAMELYFDLGLYEKGLKHALKIYKLAPDIPGNLNAVLGAYFHYNLQDSVPSFINMILKDQNDSQTLANIYFHKAVYFLQTNQPDSFAITLKTARNYFVKDTVKNKEVIALIDQKLNEIKVKAAKPAPADAANKKTQTPAVNKEQPKQQKTK